MSHKYFTINQRNKIDVLNKEGYSARKLAKILGCHHSSISRELARCTDYYCAYKANQDQKNKSKNKGRKIKLNTRLK
ncbi:MAG: helix-turn-helix domain-containing protein [Gudongella sp.]|jgi:IS30 family transposase|nr:helix-turn-helix domain-containing protein [Gudongella sp.]